MSEQAFLTRMSALYEFFQQHDAKQIDRVQRFRNIEPESAKLVAMLIRTQQSKAILEIGTSTGYSTLWLAQAAKATQAKLVTLEIDATRSQQAYQYAKELKLDLYIEFWVGDAAHYLEQNSRVFDFILLDAERSYYIDYWPALKAVIRKSGGVLVVDNVISHAVEVEQFLELIQNDDQFITTTINSGAGLFMAVAK